LQLDSLNALCILAPTRWKRAAAVAGLDTNVLLKLEKAMDEKGIQLEALEFNKTRSSSSSRRRPRYFVIRIKP
jgi:hypothetical protein